MASWHHYRTLLICCTFLHLIMGFILPQTKNDSSLLTANGQNSTENMIRLITRADGRIAEVIAPETMKFVNTRKMELEYYRGLWSQVNVGGGDANSGSKINVLGQLLKKHVHKLRSVPNGQVELVFLVDSSSSVGQENFFNELKFVKKLLADFTVAQWAARVAIITFSSRHRVHAVVDQLRNPSSDNHKCSLLNEDLPTISYVGGGTFTKGAFVEAQAVLEYARPNATKAVFLITDGYSNGEDPRATAEAMREDGVEIFTFGIRFGNVQELLDMSSDPVIEHCYILSTFLEFESLARRALHEDLEEGEYITETPEKCHSLCSGGNCCHQSAVCRCGTHTGQYECVCPPGHYGTGVEGDCRPCPMETYKPTSSPGGISTCLPCPDQYQKSPPGSSDVSQCYCGEGFRSVDKNRRCEKIRCPKLQKPAHGEFFGDSCDNSVNSACAISCEEGYESVGEVIRLCAESGEWTGGEFRCAVKACGPFPFPENGFTNCTRSEYVTGTVCTSQCNEGYTLVGTPHRKCLPIAIWDGLRTSCRVVMCRPLDPIPFVSGRITPSNCTEGSVPFQTSCKVRCRRGYTRIGSVVTRCGSDGEWQIQGSLPGQCVDVSLPTIECPEDIVSESLPNANFTSVEWNLPIVADSTRQIPRLKVFPSVSPPWNFPIGTTTIKYTAIDRAGNQNSCSFTITVTDKEPPQIEVCESPEPVYSGVEQAAIVQWQQPVFFDNSGHISNITATHSSGSIMPLGSTNVEYVAADEYGNARKCVIEVNVREGICQPLRDPAFGITTCTRLLGGGLNCTLRCSKGYSLPVNTPAYFICHSDGSWFPSVVRHRDCQATYTPGGATQRMRLFYKLRNCTVDLVSDFENHLSTTFYDKINEYCGETMSCDVKTVSTICRNNGTLQNYLNSKQNSRQQHPNNVPHHGRYQEVRELVLSSEVVGALEGSVVEVYTIINATISTSINTTATKDELDALVINLQDIPERLEEESKKGSKGLGRASVNDSQLIVLQEGIELRCNDGSVIKEKECVPCFPGMYHDQKIKVCTNCPVGTYQPLSGKISCEPCPNGTSTVGPGSDSISACKVLCNPGSYSLTGVEQCVSCPVGTYQPNYGSVSCISCQLNATTLQAGSIGEEECLASCRPGQISSSGLEPCLPCPVGSFQPSSQKQTCYMCPHNGTTSTTAATSIEDCETSERGLTRQSLLSGMTEIPFSVCFSFPCQNNGSCKDVLSGFSCVCPPGFTGLLCEEAIDECESSPCLNGTCIDLVNNFQCDCAEGFAGELCGENVDDCLPNPCLQNGLCLDEVADFKCECPNGYEGKQCEMETNECLSNPCLNGGSCVDQFDGFYCRCPDTFTGDVCSIDVAECFNNVSFYHEACDKFFRNASCENIKDYATPLCKGRIDYCSSDPCQNGGTCLNTVTGFTCLCRSELTGPVCNDALSWDFSFKWKKKGTVDYSILKGSQTFEDLHEVTVSFWMQTSDSSNYGTPFSYASDNSNDNALTMTDYTGFVININKIGDENTIVTDVNANDGWWHHIALTWNSDGGLWSLYKDGVRVENGSNLSEGLPIQGGGVFVLGQEQDQLGGGFHILESFIGEIAFLNLWPRMMSDNEILNLSQSCENPEDAVISWAAFLAGKTGNLRKETVSFCEGCLKPHPPEFGAVSNYVPDVPLLEVTYVCDQGFVVHGNDSAKCQVSGDWLPSSPPECRRIQCGFPGKLEHGDIITESYSYESVAQYECWNNYVLVGPSTRTCQANGFWTGSTPSCIRSNCGRVPVVENCDVKIEPGITPKDAVTYSCQSGYQMIGSATVYCDNEGQWSTLPFCERISCVGPILEPHVILQLTNGTSMGDIREYACEKGYILDGEPVQVCETNGTWSQPVPSCTPVPCDEFPEIAHMTHHKFARYGDLIHPSCMEGYLIDSEEAISCDSEGNWIYPLPSCLPVSCGEPPVVSNARNVSQIFSYKDNVTIECQDGYIIFGESVLFCGPMGSWYPQPPICEPVSCGLPPMVENAVDRGTKNISYGEDYSYECREGFQLEGSKVLSCQSDGTWEPKPPKCLPVTCGEIPRVLFSLSEIEGTAYGNTVVYKCEDGYEIQHGNTMVCSSVGNWVPLETKAAPVCSPLSCGPPTPIPNANVENSVFLFNETYSYSCINGYTLKGDAEIRCSSNRSWVPQPLPECQPVSCGEPPVIPHSEPLTNGTIVFSSVTYVCHVGYQLQGQAVISCSTDGEWVPSPPECIPVYCGPPSMHPNLIKVGDDLTFGQNVTFQCDDGFILSGTPVSYCLADGFWSSPSPSCNRVSCGKPPTINQGLVNTTGIHFGDSAIYHCEPGYDLLGKNRLKCGDRGYWSPSPPSCFLVSCGKAPLVENALEINGSYQYGESVSYECKEGFAATTDNDHILTCGINGTWQGHTPDCKISCGEPPYIANGLPTGDSITYGSLVTYSCLPGYIPMSTGIIRCDVDGTWKGHVTDCQPRYCSQPEEIEHGRTIFNRTTFGERVLYKCSEGHDLIGKKIRRCLATGLWSATRPVCRPIFCGEPPAVRNGIVIGENFHFNQTITFKCNAGHILMGNDISRCTASRRWNNPPPLCLKVECPPLSSPDNGYIHNLNVTFGTTVRFSCLPGYVLQGNDFRTCGEDGSWIGMEVSCTPVDCGVPPELANVTVTFTGQTLHHTAEYLCVEGFIQMRQVSLTCLENGSWTSQPKQAICELITCVPPPSLQNGYYLGKNLEYNSTVNYNCDPGYSLVGPTSLICSESGWNPNDGSKNDNFPSCQLVLCGPPPSIPNGYTSANETTYGKKAELFCTTGYHLQGISFVSCLATGKWEDPSAVCEPVTCTPPVVYDHSAYLPQKQSYEFMEAVTYACQEGYELRGHETMHCSGMNSWNGTAPFCTTVTCGDPPRPEMGGVECDSNVFGSKAFYSCYEGFSLEGVSYSQCLANGSWSKPLPACKAVSCSSPPDISYGYHIQGDFYANDTVMYLCNSGYSMAGSNTLTCSSSGLWTGPFPRCHPIQCPSLYNPKHGYVHHDGTTYLAKASYSCDTGYVLQGGSSRICQASGDWSKREPSCLPRNCSEPPTFSSAFVQNNTFARTSLYVYQTNITYECQPGFILITENTITCSASGVWEPSEVICQPIECKPPNLTNSLSYTSEGMTYQSRLVYSCPDGYAMNGMPLVICTERGEWSHPPPFCDKITCPPAETPTNGRLVRVGMFYHDTAKFVCDPGYHLHGEVEINCTINGTWSAPVPKCKPMICLKPPDIEHGIPLINKSYQRDDTIFYRCKSGYRLRGTGRRRCQKDGTWTGRDPSCIRSQRGSKVVNAPPGCVLPCLHGGQCVGHYKCDCRYGFTGSRCETVLCMPRCFNGAKCVGRHPECNTACILNGSC